MQDVNKSIVRYATINDLKALVDLHYRCFSKEEHLAMVFGRRFIEAAYKWFLTSNNTFAIVVEDEGVVTGLTTVADMPYNNPMLNNCRIEAILGLFTHPWIVFNPEIGKRFFKLIAGKPEVSESGRDEKNVAHLAFIAAHPGYRGKGIGSALLKKSMEIAKSRGLRYHRAGVYKNNIASINMFKKLGHIELKELESERAVFLQTDLEQVWDYPQ